MYTSENYKTKKKGGFQIGKRGGGYLTSYKEEHFKMVHCPK